MAVAPQPLITSLQNRRCILFVGSGISVPAGYPNWVQLVDHLIIEAGKVHPDKADSLKNYAKDHKDPLLVAEYARDKLGPQPYDSLLGRIFGKQATPQPIHKAIARTDYRAIITTNYDKLIETAVTLERGWVPTVFSYEAVRMLGTALYEGYYFVMKLHGDIHSSYVILTSQDYDRIMLLTPFVRSFLQSVLLNYTLLFVGYSLSDPDFQLVMKELNLLFQGSTPPHYALMADPHEFTIEHLKSKLNIQVIPYSSNNNHQEAADFLADLQKIAPYTSETILPEVPIAS